MYLLPLDKQGLKAARLPPVWRTRPRYWGRRLAYTLRAPSLSLIRRIGGAPGGPGAAMPSDALFVVGYWRSGTTLLHEYLALDPRRTTPTTHQCFNPQSFAVTRPGRRSTTRPMDAVPVAALSPQEDEFALAGLGGPSPYTLWLTPSRMIEEWQRGLVLDATEASTWLRNFFSFAGAVHRATGKSLLLKSPPHAFRLEILARALPQARFIYVLRNPVEVHASMLKMLREMCRAYAVEDWDERWLEEYAVRTRLLLAASIRRAEEALGPGRLAMLRYESLVAEPMDAITAVLSRLGIEMTAEFCSNVAQEWDRRRRYSRSHFADQVTIPEQILARLAQVLDDWRAGAMT